MRILTLLVVLGLLAGICAADTPERTKAKATAGDGESQYRYAQMLEQGTFGTPDVPGAVQWYERAASHGQSAAMQRLGILYYNGEVHGADLRADPQQAWIWFTFARSFGNQSAAAEADRIAQEFSPAVLQSLRTHVARSLLSGSVVPANVSKAIETYDELAHDGSADAAEVLGALYADGVRVPRDVGRAADWYEVAARSGSARAMVALGNMARSQSPPDVTKAKQWYERAAIAGSIEGLMEEAGMLERAPNQDLATAFDLYLRAARKGNAAAMLRVGEMYANGTVVATDPVEAVAWYRVSGLFDIPEGNVRAQGLELKLTADDQVRAQVRTKTILDSIEPRLASTAQ